MADSDTEICNMALGHLGIDNEIATLATDRSPEARACRKFFATIRDQALRDFPYSFARKFATLSLVQSDPTDYWAYSYRMPSDCLMPRRIVSGILQDTRQSRIAYDEGSDNDGMLIYTSQTDAVLEYTKRAATATFYPVDFVMACSLRLASVIAPQLTGGDPFKLGVQCLQKYRLENSIAMTNNANASQPEENPPAESIRARDE